MFKTTINLVPTGQAFDIYSGLTSSTTVNLIATNVTNSFEHTFEITDLVLGSNTLQHYFLKLSCEECGNILIKVKAHDIEYCQPINPFDFIFDLTLKSIIELDENPSLEPSLTNPIDWLTDVFLSNGLGQSQSCLICPPCNDFYYIGNTYTYLSMFETASVPNDKTYINALTGCCINYAMSAQTYLLDYIPTVGISNAIPPDEEIDGVVYKYSSCNNGFKEKIQLLKTLDPTKFSSLIEIGIFEVGTIGNSTGLDNLINFYTGNTINNYDGINTIGDTIQDWMSSGIFFLCHGRDYRMGDHGGFNKTIEDLTTPPPSPIIP
jgi:hypothetical protein